MSTKTAAAKSTGAPRVAQTAKPEPTPQSPLDYMLSVMRDPRAEPKRRDDMAKAAAPYVHPRLTAVDHGGDLTITHEQALDDLA